MKINILHLGFGKVGTEVVRQLSDFERVLQSRLNVELNFLGVFNSKTQFLPESGLLASQLIVKMESGGLKEGKDLDQAISKINEPFILLDTTASDQTFPYLIKALKKGGYLVLSNKKPLSGPYKNFKKLMEFGENRIFFETVVGAGLPVIKTIKDMMSTGDEIIKIEGSFSGTLGFIFTELQKGRKFSQVVKEARDQGYTEPDPRDDLSGLDIARKVLILSRLLGQKSELRKINLSGLVPDEMKDCSVEDFMQKLIHLDALYAVRIKNASKKNESLRFLGSVEKNKSSVQLLEIDSSSDIGNLKGPDNIVVVQSRRYSKNPLVIKGPGAGIEVTAAGVFTDILEAIKAIKANQVIPAVLNTLPVAV